jgi:N-acetylmuramoyl-L-alanine amidase
MTTFLHAWLTFFVFYLPHVVVAFNLSFASTTSYAHTKGKSSIFHSNNYENLNNAFIAVSDTTSKRAAYRIRTVVIDPGHGGKDPGCVGAYNQEKHIVLAISKRLKTLFQEKYPHIKVILTREDDVFIPLHERAAIANRNNADLFISVHCNAISKYFATQGSETYVLGLHRADENLAVAKRENASIFFEENYEKTYDGFDPNSDEGHILLSMYQNAFLEQSILFAAQVERRFEEVGRKSRGVKQAGFLVLRETTMPSVLLEAGFLTNRTEEAFLASLEGQEVMTLAIFNAFKDYKDFLEEGILPKITPKPSVEKIEVVASKMENNLSLPTYNVPEPPVETTKTIYYDPSKPVKANDLDAGASTVWAAKIEPLEVAVPTDKKQKTGSETTQTPTHTTHQESSNLDAYVQFRVQLAAAKQPLNMKEEKWKNLPYIVDSVWEDGMHKYQIRNITNFNEAEHIKADLLKKGFAGTFILAYKGSERISVQEANKLLSRMVGH